MKLASLLLVAMTIRLTADAPILQNPVSATFTYPNGVTVTLTQGVNSLEELTISSGETTAKIPAAEMTDIFTPWLNEVRFFHDLDPETEKSCMNVRLKYNLRTYEWGTDFSEVTFTFVEGEYHHRSTRIPTGENRWKTLEKKEGEAEQKPGESDSVEGMKETK